jgi:hypothetical protein
MPSVPHPIRALRRAITGFCRQAGLHVARQPQRLVFSSSKNLAIFEQGSSDRVRSSLTEGEVMSSAKAITTLATTLASVAVVACGLFAFSWVSLALLGF